jgi:hypothetical protein
MLTLWSNVRMEILDPMVRDQDTVIPNGWSL